MSVRDATSKIDNASEGVQTTVAQLTAPDEYGNTAGQNLRETISNANSAAGNMAEDTEALKHSFLLHGFFRHRGYYSLTGIPAAKYRKDPAFTTTRDSRSWLDASQLFAQNSKNGVELTAEGKSLLDQILARYGDSLGGVPLMVEGYDSTGNLADKIDISRERALVVRRYILAHYHLDATDVGAIGLSSLPPKGSDHTTWDGICILAVQSAH
jgi:phospholipid/cholesterol/gamma-HCH transport system substrate-binding protein